MLDVAILPPTSLERVLPDADRVWLTFKFVIVALVAVRLSVAVELAFKLSIFPLVATRLLIVAVPVAVIFVPTASPKNKLSNIPVIEWIRLERILFAEVVPNIIILLRLVITAFVFCPFILLVNVFVEDE